MANNDNRDIHKYMGTMYGLAAGDALGFPVEFMSRSDIAKKYGSNGIYRIEFAGNFPLGTYSDDTQMTLAVADGIVKSKSNSVDEIMENISNEFVKWYHSPENNRAPGMTCMEGVSNFSSSYFDMNQAFSISRWYSSRSIPFVLSAPRAC